MDMGKNSLNEILEESVRFEKNAMTLYQLFSEIFPEDRKFWKCLSGEEQYHMELVESMRQPLNADALPREMLHGNLIKLIHSNELVERLIEKFAKEHPSRQDAFNCALAFETSGSEIVFQRLMRKDSTNKIVKTFKEMAGFCKDHVRRIITWMKTNNIPIPGAGGD